jgi:hypothetical protein
MSRALRLGIVGVGLITQVFYLGTCNPYPHGDIVDVPYRQKERLAALHDSNLLPSPASRAALAEELRRMRNYERLTGGVLLGFLAAANGIAIYYLLGHGYKKRGA